MSAFFSALVFHRRKKFEPLYRFFQIGSFKLLVALLHDFAYGHQALEMLMAMSLAKKSGASLYLLTPVEAPNRALFEIKSDIVKIWRGTFLRSFIIARFFELSYLIDLILIYWDDWTRSCNYSVRRWLTNWLRKQAQNEKHTKAQRKSFRRRADAVLNDTIKDTLRQRPHILKIRERGYLRRKLLNDPIPIHLPGELSLVAAQTAQRLGITSSTRFVTLHMRETGFKSVRGTEDVGDTLRNCRIENYFKAIDFLVDQGYKIVRLGDPTMTPLNRPGVVDLTTSPYRSGLLEMWLLMNCTFLIGCDSGPVSVCYITNTPFLSVNATDPIASYPFRRNCLFMLKRAVECKTGRILPLADMLTPEFLEGRRDSSKYSFIDNSSDEIYAALLEMLAGLRDNFQETLLQEQYRKLVAQAAFHLKDRVAYVNKWGLDDEFLGDGRICHFYVDRYLHDVRTDAPGTLPATLQVAGATRRQ